MIATSVKMMDLIALKLLEVVLSFATKNVSLNMEIHQNAIYVILKVIIILVKQQ